MWDFYRQTSFSWNPRSCFYSSHFRRQCFWFDILSLDDLLDSHSSRWIDPVYLANSRQYPALFGCHFFKIDVQALADMAIFDFFSEIIAWWEAIDMFWGGMLASKVVFSPSSHRLLLPGLILQVNFSRAKFFHENVWTFIFFFWYDMILYEFQRAVMLWTQFHDLSNF